MFFLGGLVLEIFAVHVFFCILKIIDLLSGAPTTLFWSFKPHREECTTGKHYDKKNQTNLSKFLKPFSAQVSPFQLQHYLFRFYCVGKQTNSVMIFDERIIPTTSHTKQLGLVFAYKAIV